MMTWRSGIVGARARRLATGSIAPVIVAAFVAAGTIRPASGASDGGVRGWESPAAARGGHPATAPGQDCTSCHTMDTPSSHPVGVVPSMPIPAGLPLLGGVMTCTTCHTEPGSADPGVTSSMLRSGELPGGLCVQCHTPGGSPGGRGFHGDAMIKAHAAPWQGAGERARPTSGRVDAESRTCLSCHDGGVAGGASYHSEPLRRMAAQGVGEHPVGIVYNDRRPSNPETKLRPASSLPHAVRLVDGTVSCVTCHSVYSREPKLLTKSNRGSELCLSCHIQ